MKYYNDFRIQKDGDSFEKIGWDLFVKDKFPNYEIFWANFIASKTNRDINPNDIWFKDDVDDEFRVLSMLHYGIFLHFLFIYHNIKNTNSFDIFAYCYIKLSSIVDLTEEFLFKLFIFTKQIQINQIVNEYKMKQFVLTDNDIKDQLYKRSSLSIQVASKLKFIKQIKNCKSMDNFEKLSISIKGYRNILIHSWPVFQIGNKVPIKNFVLNKDYRDWTKIINKLKIQSEAQVLVSKHFKDKISLVTEDTELLIKTINDIWEFVISEMEKYGNKQSKN